MKKFFILFLCIVIVLLQGCNRSEELLLVEESTVTDCGETEAPIQESGADSVVYVHICGAVMTPGVYELPMECRLYEAIEAAGGFADNADSSAVNLARLVRDGEQVDIPFIGEESGDGGSKAVNINKASAEELMTISGIGKSRAEAIIAYREEKGGFSSTEELLQVNGIKDGLYTKILPYICCE